MSLSKKHANTHHHLRNYRFIYVVKAKCDNSSYQAKGRICKILIRKKIVFMFHVSLKWPQKRHNFRKRYTNRQAFGKLNGCLTNAISIRLKRCKPTDIWQVKHLPNDSLHGLAFPFNVTLPKTPLVSAISYCRLFLGYFTSLLQCRMQVESNMHEQL